ncbi:ATP-binding protein [Streptomyces sp. NPDC090306]|uniref:ATP-binding protein n=1 Tax=Streptomyces sp. NPDC090306 TaxID=3365961 RepID=UPI0038011FEB
MSTNEVGAPTQPAPPSPGGIRGFADRWPFRRKLNILVGVPLTVISVLLVYLIADQVGQARDAADAAGLVRDSASVATLVDRVEAEHQQAILLSVRYEAAAGGGKPSLKGYRAAQTAVDKQVEKVRDTFGDRLPDTEAQALREVSGLGSLRSTIEQSYLPADNIDPAYISATQGLIDGLGLDHNPSFAATYTGNLLDSLLRADAAHSSFETTVFSATTGDTNALIEFTTAVGAYELYTDQADRFGRFATEEQTDELGGIEHGKAQSTIAQQYAELQVDPSGLQATSPAQLQHAINTALAAYPDYRAQSGTRLKITASLIGQIADRADGSSDDAWWRAGWLLAGALLGFVVWLAFSVAVRRSVVRPVQTLTGAARQVADVAGRELARVADDDAEDAGPPRLREVPVVVRDEIGELAEAFNHVQSTAAALLERQVLSRRNTAEMFGNVGRRVSNLTTRQLGLIDAVERGETDPAILERLYGIDHIAVRLRRNADSLMLLAGIRETVLDSGPTALTNVVRAALGQIEGYQRVRLHTGTDVMVQPDIIGDLTLMVAELLENAVAFSPVGSSVEVNVRSGGGGALISVADHGLGMSDERIAEENARLIRRERLDLVPTKVLGLFVVGTLARRWDITVTLSRTPGGGVTAQVELPTSLLLTMRPLNEAATGVPRQRPAAPAVEAPAAPALSGPLPAASVQGDSGHGRTEPPGYVPGPDEFPAHLPRRVPRRETPAAQPPATGAPAAETAPERFESAATPPAAAAGDGPYTRRRDTGGETEPGRHGGHHRADGSPPATGPAPFIPRARDGAPADPHPADPYRPDPYRSEQRPADAQRPGIGAAFGTRPADGAPAPRGQQPPAAPLPGAGDDGERPLRRRVRGATLRTPLDGAQQTARQAPRLADADAVRDSLEEFEAAVARANRDSTTPGAGAPRTSPDQQTQHDLPKGVEQ